MIYRTFNLIVILVGTSFILWNCVDVSEPTISTQNYRSLVRFVHVAGDAPASGPVTVDGASVGSIAFGQSTAYLDLPSGSRSLSFAGTPQNVAFNTDDQATVLVHSLDGSNRFLYLLEGDKSKNNGIPGVAKVKFVNVAKGSAANISFREGSATGTNLAASVGFVSAPTYSQVTPGSHTIYVASTGTYMDTIDGSQEVPPVTTTSSGTGTFTLSATGGIVYNISVTSDNSQGFYLFAHFHNAPAGIIGGVVKAINVSGQQITFPAASLSGLNEVPPEITTASGTGVFTLTANAARDTFSLAYSIAVTADTLDSVFIAAHFHTGAAGANGGIVRTLATGPFGDTTITGTWSTGDSEPLTAGLVTELLAGRIYVNFHSVIRPGGAIRAQVTPNPTSTNAFSGTWNDPSLTDSLKREVVLGNIYVNFHTAANPVGQIRGKLVVDPSKGDYGVASLPAADTSFAAGNMYTIVASGSGTSLQLLKLTDRLGPNKPAAGLSKPVEVKKSQQTPKSSIEKSE